MSISWSKWGKRKSPQKTELPCSTSSPSYSVPPSTRRPAGVIRRSSPPGPPSASFISKSSAPSSPPVPPPRARTSFLIHPERRLQPELAALPLGRSLHALFPGRSSISVQRPAQADSVVMAALFAGVSTVAAGKLCSTLSVDVGTNSGYHLLAVKDYSRTTLQEMQVTMAGPFMVGGHKWFIHYYPNGAGTISADHISLELCLDHDDGDEEAVVEAKCRFSFVDQFEMHKPKGILAMKTCSFYAKKIDLWGLPSFFIRKDALERSAHLKAGCFTIRCDIMVCNNPNTQDVDGTLPDIGEHLKILFQDKVGSDVTFEVSGETFTAHRCVLAARSKVFKAQLFGPMTEGITPGVIQIKDMEAKVFAALLSFIYSDSFPEMEEEDEAESVEGEEEALEVEENGEQEAVEVEMTEDEKEEQAAEPDKWLQWLQDLLVAADRFDIQQLKVLCEKKLSKHIDVSSVTSTLVLAEQHHCHGLKEACLMFIQVQSLPCLGKVMKTDGWKHISTTYPSVLDELIVKFASSQKNKRKRASSPFENFHIEF